MRRYLFRFLLIALILLLGGGYLWLRSSLPRIAGTEVLPGLEAQLRIIRDEHGIPTIIAANDRDAAFALGFLHGQDRLFQMDAMRHYGAGRISEWFGTRTVAIDRTMRTLGLYRAAARQYDELSPELRAVLDAYATGVNAFLAHRRGALPPEYYLLNITPEPWQPADSLVWGKLMALQLSGNYRHELLHARLAQHLSPADLQILFPDYPKGAPIALGDTASLLDKLPLDRLYAALPPAVGPSYASNNWVVDGRHSQSGKPLLANDPHLGFSAPGIWYLARIETPSNKIAGVTSPGTPFVILGHNEHIAWGFTTTTGDVEDLFIERVDPADPTRYLTPTGPQPFTTRSEQITVRNGDPVTITIRETRHGPVVSDLEGDPATLAPEGHVLALQATWRLEGDRSPEALWGLDRARNWTEFRQALQDFAAPQQNIVYADIDGNIGFMAPARIPIRAKGDGWMPVPGWTGDYDWTGFIPFDALPSAFNPPQGRIATANNKIVPDSYPYFLSRDWDLPNRAERINQLLDATPRQSPDSSAMMQADTLSLMAKDLLPLMLKAQPASSRAAEAMAVLRAWDGHMDRDRIEPLLFTAWLREFNRTILADKLGAAFGDYWELHPDVIHLILTEHRDWCDASAANVEGACEKQLAVALDRALAQLDESLGADMRSWQWGRVHEARFSNALWSNVPVLRDLFALNIPADGGYDTLNRGATPIRSPASPYASVHGATLRMIVDLAAPDDARFMIAPGQSGNPLSPHYGDLMQPWRDFEWLRLGDAPSAGSTLVLAPP